MNHIELAIEVIKKEISKLNYDLKYCHLLPKVEEEIIEELQKLNRAVNDIRKLNER